MLVGRPRGGRRAAATLALALSLSAALLAPVSTGAFSKAIWGQPTRAGIDQFPLYHRLGVTIYETTLRWDVAAPSRPRRPGDPRDSAYRWPAALDEAIAGARRFGIKVMLQVMFAPPWANGGHSDPAWAPRNPDDYAAFATAAARRYPGVHLWMVWGEPVKAGNWRPLVPGLPGIALSARQRVAPHLYARVLDAAYGALKRVSRANRVIGGSTYTTGAIDTLHWIANLRLPNGRPPRMDLYGHNPFSHQDPTFSGQYSPFDQAQFSDLPELAGWIDRYLKPGLPLFLSEWTIPTAADNEFNFYVDPPVAAKWIREAMSESRRWRRIYALGWVNVYDSPPKTYGGLLSVDGNPKPTFDAFARG